jgi:hypothetical protein
MLIPSSILQAIHGHCLVNFNGILYMIGGTTDLGASDEVYTLECGVKLLTLEATPLATQFFKSKLNYTGNSCSIVLA